MKTVTHDSSAAEAIRQRMEEVRCDLDEDVQEIVEGARDMGKWRSYVRSYPWVCVGAAMAVGYLVVPRRPSRVRLDEPLLAELASHRASAAPWSPTHGRGMLRALVGSLVMRGVAAYVGQQASKLFATRGPASPQDDQS